MRVLVTREVDCFHFLDGVTPQEGSARSSVRHDFNLWLMAMPTMAATYADYIVLVYDRVQARGTFATHPFLRHISPYKLLFFYSTPLPPLLQDTNPL